MKRKAAVRYLLHSYRNPLSYFLWDYFAGFSFGMYTDGGSSGRGGESQFRQWS